jgi:transcriptional regulator NrdR family protein
VTSCPECASSNLKSLGTEHGDREDDEHQITVWKYKCQDCGCKFEVIERIEWETEVLKHGSQAEEEEP